MNNDFGALTILAPKCQKCPKVETCDHKQLAHLANCAARKHYFASYRNWNVFC